MPTELPVYDDFVEHVLDAARRVGMTFTKPDDDWQMVAHFVQPFGDGYRAGVAQLPPIASPRQQDGVLKALVKLIAKERVVMMSLIQSAWVTRHEMATPEDAAKLLKAETYEEARKTLPNLVPPTESSEREEVLSVIAFSPTQATVAVADIVRTTHSAPHLAEWNREDFDELDASIGGRWAHKLFAAVRANA
jgi:hypothetical protein